MGCSQSKQNTDVIESVAKGDAAPDAGEEKKEESTGFFGGIVDAVQDAVENVQDAVDDIQDAVGDAMDAAQNLATMLGSPYEIFESKLEIGVVKTLQWVSPKAADKVKTTMTEKVPMLQGSDATKLAHKTVRTHIMETKDDILDMCQDLLEDLQDGMKPMKALKTTFRKVGTLILRALKGAVTAGVMAVVGCAACCTFFMNSIQEGITSMLASLTKMVKKFLKKILNKHAPDFLVAKLPWDWKAEDDVGDKPKVQQKKEQGIQTSRQKMGKPDREEKAEKIANKKNKHDIVDDDDAPQEDDGPDDEGWDDDDDDEEEDGEDEEDFDNEKGGDSDEDIDEPKKEGEAAPAAE